MKMIKKDKAGVAAALFPAGCAQLFNNLEEKEGVSMYRRAMDWMQKATRRMLLKWRRGVIFHSSLEICGSAQGCWLVSKQSTILTSGWKNQEHRDEAAWVTPVLSRIRIKIQHSWNLSLFFSSSLWTLTAVPSPTGILALFPLWNYIKLFPSMCMDLCLS